MSIKRFEEIEAWQEARRLVNMVYDLTDKTGFRRDFGLKDQIQRSSVSCMSNIAEGFGGDTNQQFLQHLFYARRSSSEVQSHLYVAWDREYISQEEFDFIYNQAQKVGMLTNGFIRYLRSESFKPANELTDKQENGLTGQRANELTGKRANGPTRHT
jgi:four helix bundle protein